MVRTLDDSCQNAHTLMLESTKHLDKHVSLVETGVAGRLEKSFLGECWVQYGHFDYYHPRSVPLWSQQAIQSWAIMSVTVDLRVRFNYGQCGTGTCINHPSLGLEFGESSGRTVIFITLFMTLLC